MQDLNKYLILQDKKMQEAMNVYGRKSAKRRAKLTPGQRILVWEHPEIYGRKCHICGHKITKMSDMELDHKHPYKSGGKIMNLAHKWCNKIKGAKGLRHIQKKMGFSMAKRKTRSDKGKPKSRAINPYGSFKIPKFQQPKFDFGI